MPLERRLSSSAYQRFSSLGSTLRGRSGCGQSENRSDAVPTRLPVSSVITLLTLVMWLRSSLRSSLACRTVVSTCSLTPPPPLKDVTPPDRDTEPPITPGRPREMPPPNFRVFVVE